MKRIYSILLALCVSSMLFAQLSIWNGSSDIWTKGAGTEASPYLIESAEQLAFISDMVNGGVTTYENTYFKLMTNIDLNNLTWVPIGDSKEKAFKGNFDGNNFWILGNNQRPLFGYCLNSTLWRINVELKGLVTTANRSVFEHCSSHGTMAMTDSAYYCSFTKCHSNIKTSGRWNDIGGIANVATQCTLINCKTYGDIENAGGDNRANSSWGPIDNAGSTAGIVAQSTSSRFIKCCSHGNLTSLYYAGGIICNSYHDIVEYCYSTCNMRITDNNFRYSGVGGIICFCNKDAQNQYSDIKNSYTADYSIYGIDGYRYAELGNWRDSGSGNVTDVINSYSRSDKTEASMKSASFPIILNTDSTVFIQDKYGVNDGYPIYKEQVYAVTTPATDVQLTSAILNANYYALNADSIGFEYKQTNDKTHWYKRIAINSSLTDTSYKLEGLETGTDYTFRFWVAQNGVIHFGEALTFTTQECSTNTYPETATICDGEEYEFANKILTKSGVYYDTLTAVNGCDSVIELTLTVSPVNEIQKYDTIFVGDSYDFFGQILTETGTYTHYVPAGTYCNLVIMNLYVKQPSVVVTATSADKTMGTVEGSGTYEKYSSVTITAIPNEGYRFENWNDGDTNGKRILVLSSDTTLTAYFQPIKYVITAIANDEKLGTVYGGGEYAYNTSVSLMAVANDGAEFVTWTNGVVENPYIFKAVENMAIQAIFKTIPSGVDDVQVDENTTTKILQNGQLFIIRDGKTYTVMGQEVK